MDSYNSIVKDLRRDAYSVKGRLQSIIYDNRFVSTFDNYALVANERCGLWYVQPHQIHGSVYFKSTDGHTGQWRFSLRRLNFNLLPILGRNGTVVLVDSTRKGKLMPDALLKTAPIWCAVLNYILFEDQSDDLEVPEAFKNLQKDNWLATPREMVSESEHHAIAQKIPEFAREVTKLQLITKKEITKRLGKKMPIVPQWQYPGKEAVEERSDCFSLCCLTASAREVKSRDWPYSFPYIQGAADDHELWATKEIAQGKLDHEVFWERIYYEPEDDVRIVDMATGDIYPWLSEEEMILRINRVYDDDLEEGQLMVETKPLGDTGLFLGKIADNIPLNLLEGNIPGLAEIILLSPNYTIEVPELISSKTYSSKVDGKSEEVKEVLNHGPQQILVKTFKIESSKKGAKELRGVLVDIIADYNPQKKVLVLCESGTDLSAGICLCFLSRWFTLDWKSSEMPLHVNKDIIKQHLSKIQDFHNVNPSRNTLQSVNSCLMGGR